MRKLKGKTQQYNKGGMENQEKRKSENLSFKQKHFEREK